MEEKLRQILTGRAVKRLRDTGRVLSAVLLPLYRRDGEYHLLFTKRTDLVQDHKGQISFPGGACETGDGSLLQTALRECREELGLEPESVRVLGRLDDALTRTSNYVISPFVAVIPWPYDLVISRGEVAEIIEIPVAALCGSNGVRRENEIIDGKIISPVSYHYRDKVIWGATARILQQFLEIFALAAE